MNQNEYRRELDHYKHQIDGILKHRSFLEQLTRSTVGISKLFLEILDPTLPDWTKIIDEKEEYLLTPKQQEDFKRILNPHLDSIRAFFNRPVSSQTGGQAPAVAPPDAAPANASAASTAPANASAAASTAPAAATASAAPATAAAAPVTSSFLSQAKDMAASGWDWTKETIHDGIQNMDQINDATYDIAKNYGILKYETSQVKEPDWAIFSWVPHPVISQIKVPFQMIITTIYLCLDVARMIAGMIGAEQKRSTLSMIVALMEFLRGDWKRAVLTFMGVFGSGMMWVGQYSKIVLIMFQTLSPSIQARIMSGTLTDRIKDLPTFQKGFITLGTIAKSFVFGTLLSLFQMVAPKGVRDVIISKFMEIDKNKKAVDEKLKEKGLPPRPSYLSPAFLQMSNFQALLDDPAYACSCTVQEFVKKQRDEQKGKSDSSAMGLLILQLFGIPVDGLSRAYQCNGTQCLDYGKFPESIVKEQKDRLEEMVEEHPGVVDFKQVIEKFKRAAGISTNSAETQVKQANQSLKEAIASLEKTLQSLEKEMTNMAAQGTAAQGTAAQSVKDKFIAKMKGIDLEKLLLPYLQKDKITEEEIKQLEKDLEKFKPIAKQQLINQIKNQGRVTRATLTRKKQNLKQKINLNEAVL